MIFDKNQKRLLVYFFYDRDGIVDRYIDYMLENITKHVDELVVVCNGKLCDSGRDIFEKYTKDIIVRENIGFDVWAYKTALEYVGMNRLDEYGEIIMMNFTIMGPLYPFSEMFEVMDKKDLDFWGITLFHGASFDPFGKIKYGYLPMHIQSHFIAVRSDMLSSEEFKNYWISMPMINCYEEAVGYHEAIFTKTFADYGYTWDVYVDTRDEADRCYYPMIVCPKSLVEERRCPIIKRKSFFQDYQDMLESTTGEATVELLEYIKNNLDYDINMIYENILRVENQADIKRNMHLTYILPNNVDNATNIDITNKKIALFMHIYFKDLIEYCYRYALSMPDNSDIYITTDSTIKKKEIEKIFSEGPWENVKVIRVENRGRDVSALLIAIKEYLYNYDYVCFMHDKKVGQLNAKIKGESFSYKCFENLLKSKCFVKNVINTFVQNEKLGVLMPPPPNFAEYYPTLGRVDWGENYDNTVELAKALEINVKMDERKEPVAPLGSMFWVRPCALKKLYDKNWKYEDFPEEPGALDGSVSHAIERIRSYVVQAEGYYPAWVMNEKYAAIEVDNLYYMLRELNMRVFDLVGTNTHAIVINRLEQMKNIIYDIERSVGKLYIATEDGMDEKNSELYIQEGETNYYEYTELEKYGKVKEFRWDPGELAGIEVRIHDIEIVLSSGETIYKGINDVVTNGIRIDEALVFINKDPQIYFSLADEAEIEKIIIIAHVDKAISEQNMLYIKDKMGQVSFKRKLINKMKRVIKR